MAKIQDNVVAKATAALKESVRLIIGDDDYDDAEKAHELAATFAEFQTYLEKAGVDGGGSKDDSVGKVDHHASTVADLLTEAGTFPHRTAALHYLLNKPGGQALLDRLHKAAEQTEKDDPPMDSILQIMKSGGIGPTCAAIVAKGSTTISEHELVEAATKVAAERHPELSPAQSFSRVYSAATDEARCLRDAIKIAKSTEVSVISGGDLRDAGDAAQAMDQLREIGRRMAPTATPEKQFSVALLDPKNAALANRAHRRPSPTTSFAYPR
jgi:hypothetical protein